MVQADGVHIGSIDFNVRVDVADDAYMCCDSIRGFARWLLALADEFDPHHLNGEPLCWHTPVAGFHSLGSTGERAAGSDTGHLRCTRRLSRIHKPRGSQTRRGNRARPSRGRLVRAPFQRGDRYHLPGRPHRVVGMNDPFIDAYQRLKAYVAEGHTQQEVTEFAQQLNRELPQDNDIATAMIKIRAIEQIVRDLNGETVNE